MVQIGKYNTLTVNRLVDFGAYLDGGDGQEILLPAKFMPDGIKEGDALQVFVYTDSEDRPIATTQRPYATVGEFAYLQVSQVNNVGAFLDWGLEAKDLLVPYSEQRVKMVGGGIYLVYIYLDHATQRVVASAKIEKYLDNVLPNYRKGQEVKALIIGHTPIGYRCIVDNLHSGMLYSNEVYRSVELESTVTAYVKHVREDGKIDLSISDRARKRTNTLAEQILDALRDSGGELPLNDKSEPEAIKRAFACSKRDFKQAIGHLYKGHLIDILPTSIKLV